MGTTIDLDEVVGAVDGGPEGPSIGAFLDVDRTVIAGDLVDLAAAQEQSRRRGGVDLGRLARSLPVMGGGGGGEPPEPVAAVVAGWEGRDASDVAEQAERLFAKRVAPRVYAEVRDLVGAHRRKGHTVVLTSSAPRPLVRPVADALGVEHVVCTEPEGLDGRLTGRLAGPVCAGEEGAGAIRRFAAEHEVDLGRSVAYAGDVDAVPLLALAGTAVAVNPDEDVTRVAGDRGWAGVRLQSRGRPAPETVVRSLAAYGTMLPSMLGGVAMGVLNRDRSVISQYGVNTWMERLFALTGVKLDVQGEEHLWSHRPAVFVFNHRNNFDPYVAIKLVHRDWGSVGKKELAGPLSGFMQWLLPNVAFIDRSDAAKAVAGLEPVTQLLRSGTSVIVSPEGTRSVGGRLGPFKKGPFRMAMTAGVPIVPIVIRNADQVADREAGLIRSGTIDVVVLPPVEVEGWTSDDLDDRIAVVRQQYVETLADWPRG